MLDRALNHLATIARFGHATRPGTRLGRRPEQALVLYEYEGCPMCRRVREAITDLALPVEIRPCPKGGTRFRLEAVERSGASRFPFLVDPNTDTAMLESTDIVGYLYEQYGTGSPPSWLLSGGFEPSSVFASIVRHARTSGVCASCPPTQMLRLHGAEADPGTRRVRERLCELEISFLWEPGALRLVDDVAECVVSDVEGILVHLQRYALSAEGCASERARRPVAQSM
jgi:hypothetical protein